MLKKIVQNFMAPRHFWREDALLYAAKTTRSKLKFLDGFDELTELYINALFRGLALSTVGLFIPVYLLQLGYSVTAVLSVVAWYFTIRGIAGDMLSGFTVAKIGPKHTILIGYLLLIGSSAMFLTLGTTHWPIWLLGGLWGVSSSFFFIPFNVGFSKVKHSKHGGKELSYMNIMDKLGHFLGPILGALTATIFGGQYIFLVAGVLLLMGSITLLQTAEPVKLKQKLDFRELHVEPIKRDIIAFCAIGIENNICLFMWPLFLGLFIIPGPSVYTKLGVLASASVVLGVASAYGFGKLVDKKHGRRLLRISASANSILHIFRIFVNSYPIAFGLNMANETITAGYRMPFFKGYYDAADAHPGQRIVYLTALETMGSIVRATMWWVFVLASMILAARSVITLSFIIAAVASLMIMTERFKGLDAKPIMQKV